MHKCAANLRQIDIARSAGYSANSRQALPHQVITKTVFLTMKYNFLNIRAVDDMNLVYSAESEEQVQRSARNIVNLLETFPHECITITVFLIIAYNFLRMNLVNINLVHSVESEVQVRCSAYIRPIQ